MHTDIASAIIGGYCAERRPSVAEAHALPLLLPLVHAEFALSELAYFHGIASNAADSDAAYNEFLLGHAAWFGTASGQHFTEAVRDAIS